MLKNPTILDISIPEDAREYIKNFEIPGAPSKPSYVTLSSGRKIEFATMSDDDACIVAHLLHDMKMEAVERAIKN